MLTRWQWSSVFLALIIITVISGRFDRAQDRQIGVLERRVAAIQVSSSNFHEVLGKLVYKYDVPIGIEVPPLDDPPISTNVTIDIPNGNVRQVLDAVTTVAPHYTWKDVNGAINIVPIADKEPLLDVLIKDFRAADLTTDEISCAITESPEVKAALSEFGLRRNDTDIIPSGKPKNPKRYSFRLRDVSVRDALNYVIRTTDNRYWVLYRLGPRRQYFTIMV